MKIKRLIPVLLAIALVFCACGSGGETETETIPTEIQEGDSQLTLFSNDDCALTLDSVGRDAAGDYCWTVRMENKTGGNLVFSVDQVAVNEFEADPCWAENAPAMQTTTSTISWSTAKLEASGIQSVDRVDFLLTVSPYKDGTDPIVQETITVYPNGAEAYQPVAFTPDADDAVLVDAPEVFFASTGCDPDDEKGYTLSVYLENHTGQSLEYTVENVKINGQFFDTYWYRTLDAGKKGFDSMSWLTDEMRSLEIYQVSRIEFDLIVNDAVTLERVFEQHCVVEP